jgi:DNA polymerase-3 subunit alpha
MSFFGEGGFAAPPTEAGPQFPNVQAWSESQLLAAEKDTLGFYVSSHPLVRYGRELESLSAPEGVSLSRLEQQPERFRHESRIRVGCTIASVRPTFTRKDNRKMAMLTLEDLTGKCDAVVFPKTYEAISELLEADAMVFITGTVDRSRDRSNIIVDEITPIDHALEAFTGEVQIILPAGADRSICTELVEILQAHHGLVPVFVRTYPIHRSDVEATIRVGSHLSVSPSRDLVTKLEQTLGDQKHLHLQPRPVAPPSTSGRRRNFNGRAQYTSTRPSTGIVSAAVTRFN